MFYRFLLLLMLFISIEVYGRLPHAVSWGGAEGFGIWGVTQEKMRAENNRAIPLELKTPLPVPTAEFMLATRTRNLHAHPGKRYFPSTFTAITPPYGVRLTTAGGDTLDVLMAVELQETLLGDDELPVMEIRHSTSSGMVRTEKIELTDRPLYTGSPDNVLCIRSTGGGISVETGVGSMRRVWSDGRLRFSADTMAYLFYPGASAEILSGTLMCFSSLLENEDVADVDSLRRNMEYSRDLLEGEWEYLDRTLDETLLRLGGRYRLLCARTGEGRYNLYYLSGATVNPELWRVGMIKARLIADGTGRYRLSWRDADGEWLTHDLTAALETERILQLLFPYQQSMLRLLRTH